ncbi:FIST N-terminal domain-containing protein [Dongia sp.]|uniref:FIST signal transduction protein n=1 Tax=Dongia sp. TaxID=1977262 RepID=UPI0035AE9527
MSGATERAFVAAHAADGTWQELVKSCVARLTPLPKNASLGFVYVTDALADDLGKILKALKERTGVQHWVGSVGLGICSPGAEIFERPAVSVMLATLPDGSFQVFSPLAEPTQGFDPKTGAWLNENRPALSVVHGDPRGHDLGGIVASISSKNSHFVVGGVTSARKRPLQVADEVTEGGISGAMFGPEVTTVTGFTQGCRPIGPMHRITAAHGNVITMIDDRPATDVLREEIGELLSRDLHRITRQVFPGFKLMGGEDGEYLVRNFTGFDIENKTVTVGYNISAGDSILFCRRDASNAIADLQRMLEGIKRRTDKPVRGGLYFSCIMRGPNLFAAENEEVDLIRATLGDIPLAGFFGNGEISGDQIYFYTSVFVAFV